jgi:hypothetical protein
MFAYTQKGKKIEHQVISLMYNVQSSGIESKRCILRHNVKYHKRNETLYNIVCRKRNFQLIRAPKKTRTEKCRQIYYDTQGRIGKS